MEKVGAFNVPPLFLLGLGDALTPSGYVLEPVEDPVGWSKSHPRSVLLVRVKGASDLEVVVDLKAESPDAVVVTLVDDTDADAISSSLRAGAAGAIGGESAAAEVALVFDAALVRNVVMPVGAARDLTTRATRARDPGDVDEFGVEWLRRLASGARVADLAADIGYSEREMYRRLRALYERLGATNRTSALLEASRLGWLD